VLLENLSASFEKHSFILGFGQKDSTVRGGCKRVSR
jgi:hypothetical protein